MRSNPQLYLGFITLCYIYFKNLRVICTNEVCSGFNGENASDKPSWQQKFVPFILKKSFYLAKNFWALLACPENATLSNIAQRNRVKRNLKSYA